MGYRSYSQYLSDQGKYREAEWEMSGSDYPWIYGGVPILPWVFYQGESSPSEILPVRYSMVQDTLDVILQRTWISWVAFVGSFQKALVLSEDELSGFEDFLLDPTNISNVFGSGNQSVEIIPDSTSAAQALWEIHRDRVQEIVNRYSANVQVRQSDQPKSGVALNLEMSGLWQYRAAQEIANRDKDINLIRVLISSWNYWVDSGGAGERIDEADDISVRYEVSWTADEVQRMRADLLERVKLGLASPVDLYLLEHDLQDSPEARAQAMEYFLQVAREQQQLRSAGLSLLPAPQVPTPSPAPQAQAA